MKEKPTALLISYIYPPAGGGGSPRLVRWTRALFDAGYEPIVITVKPTFTRGEDQSLVSEVAELARIERTSSLDPKRLFFLLQTFFKKFKSNSSVQEHPPSKKSHIWGPLWRILQLIRTWLLLPDQMIGWLPFAFFRAGRIIRKEKPLLILTSSSPPSVQLTGLLLKKIFKLPWLADFRDAWSLHPTMPFPTRMHRWLNAKMESQVMKNADLITLAYGLTLTQKAYPEYKDKFYLLHNGFCEKDFEGAQGIHLPGFNLVHLGAFYESQTPEYFFLALKNFLKEMPELKSELKVWMIGIFNPAHLELVRNYQLEEIIILKEFIPHSQVSGWLLGADVLLLFLSPELKSSIVIPGKVFEYIRSPAWILAMIPEGETAEILRNAGGSMIVAGDDVNQIQVCLKELYQLWREGKKPFRNQEYVRTKEDAQLKKEMIKILSSLLPNPEARN